MKRKWGAFAGKLFFSLFVVWIVASVVLWFFYPTTIFEIWQWTIIVATGAIGLLAILGLVSVAVLGISVLIENGWFHKVFMLPKKYMVWLTKDLRRDKTTEEIADEGTWDVR